MDKTTNDGEAISTAEHTEAHGDEIKTYRRLDDDQIAQINELKALEQAVADHLAKMQKHAPDGNEFHEFGRHLSAARGHLRTGFMYAVRAVARPVGGL